MALEGISFEDLWRERRVDVELIVARVLKGYGDHETFQSLLLAGQVALWKATKTFDATKVFQSSFWSYARRRVQGAMLDELRARDHLGRSGRTELKGGSVEKFSWGLVYPHPLEDARDVPTGDNPEQNADHLDRIAKIVGTFNVLTEQEQTVIKGILLEHKSQQELMKELGVSEGRISQLKAAAAVNKIKFRLWQSCTT